MMAILARLGMFKRLVKQIEAFAHHINTHGDVINIFLFADKQSIDPEHAAVQSNSGTKFPQVGNQHKSGNG